MVIAQSLAVVAYLVAIVADHPSFDTPERLNKFSGFLRIGVILLLIAGLITALTSFSTTGMVAFGGAVLIVMLLAVYDYMIMAKRTQKAAKDNIAKAGKAYLDAKTEAEKGPDQVTNVQGDAVEQKRKETTVDQSTTNIESLDQSTTTVDQSTTNVDQRTHVEDSVVNRSDLGGSTERGEGDGNGTSRSSFEPSGAESDPADHTTRGNSAVDSGATGGHSSPAGGHNRRAESAGTSADDGGRAADGGDESRFCTQCGTEVESDWKICPSCGNSL